MPSKAKPKSEPCWGSNERVMLSVGEALDRRSRCSRCGRMLKIRVPASVDEATLPRHNAPAKPAQKV
jgi:hypothetical protein